MCVCACMCVVRRMCMRVCVCACACARGGRGPDRAHARARACGAGSASVCVCVCVCVVCECVCVCVCVCACVSVLGVSWESNNRKVAVRHAGTATAHPGLRVGVRPTGHSSFYSDTFRGCISSVTYATTMFGDYDVWRHMLTVGLQLRVGGSGPARKPHTISCSCPPQDTINCRSHIWYYGASCDYRAL